MLGHDERDGHVHIKQTDHAGLLVGGESIDIVDRQGRRLRPGRDGDYATRLYAWLTERFGSDQVFWDHEDIQPGASLGEVLRERIRTYELRASYRF